MARGWESKSVEDQIAEAEERKRAAATPKLSTTEIAERDRLANLQMARARLCEQISRARSEAHKQRLKLAIADIEAQFFDRENELP